MAVRDACDLQCWRLADRLRSDVLGLCKREEIRDERRFCNGFSLAELKDYLKECEERGVIDAAELARLVDRCEHTKATATKFMKPHLTKVQRSKKSRQPK